MPPSANFSTLFCERHHQLLSSLRNLLCMPYSEQSHFCDLFVAVCGPRSFGLGAYDLVVLYSRSRKTWASRTRPPFNSLERIGSSRFFSPLSRSPFPGMTGRHTGASLATTILEGEWFSFVRLVFLIPADCVCVPKGHVPRQCFALLTEYLQTARLMGFQLFITTSSITRLTLPYYG
jgi:hypothetical protein